MTIEVLDISRFIDSTPLPIHRYLIFLSIGLTTFTLCLWIRFDLDFWEWVEEIDWYTYWYCMYVIMFAMVFVIINSALGVYGVIQVGILLVKIQNSAT